MKTQIIKVQILSTSTKKQSIEILAENQITFENAKNMKTDEIITYGNMMLNQRYNDALQAEDKINKLELKLAQKNGLTSAQITGLISVSSLFNTDKIRLLTVEQVLSTAQKNKVNALMKQTADKVCKRIYKDSKSDKKYVEFKDLSKAEKDSIKDSVEYKNLLKTAISDSDKAIEKAFNTDMIQGLLDYLSNKQSDSETDSVS